MSFVNELIRKYSIGESITPINPDSTLPPLPPPPDIPETLSEADLAELAKRMEFKYDPEAENLPPTGVIVPNAKIKKSPKERAIDDLLAPKTPSEVEALRLKQKSPQELFQEFDKLLKEDRQEEPQVEDETDRPPTVVFAESADSLLQKCTEYCDLAFK